MIRSSKTKQSIAEADSISNVNDTAIPLTVSIEDKWRAVNGTIITHENPTGFNYKNNQTEIIPKPLNLTTSHPADDGAWTWDVPGHSITVLQFELS